MRLLLKQTESKVKDKDLTPIFLPRDSVAIATSPVTKFVEAVEKVPKQILG